MVYLLCNHSFGFKKMMGYLGLQDATRRMRPITQYTGECTETIVTAIQGFRLSVKVSQKKLNIVKGILELMMGYFMKGNDRPKLDLNILELNMGFLVHLSTDYPLTTPFLKIFYLMMNSWR